MEPEKFDYFSEEGVRAVLRTTPFPGNAKRDLQATVEAVANHKDRDGFRLQFGAAEVMVPVDALAYGLLAGHFRVVPATRAASQIALVNSSILDQDQVIKVWTNMWLSRTKTTVGEYFAHLLEGEVVAQTPAVVHAWLFNLHWTHVPLMGGATLHEQHNEGGPYWVAAAFGPRSSEVWDKTGHTDAFIRIYKVWRGSDFEKGELLVHTRRREVWVILEDGTPKLVNVNFHDVEPDTPEEKAVVEESSFILKGEKFFVVPAG